MHAATSDVPFFRPMALAEPADENDTDARLIREVLAKLWDLMTRADAEPGLRPSA